MPLPSGPTAHAVIGENWEVADIDSTYAALLGHPRTAIVGHPALDFIHPQDRAPATAVMRRAWIDGKTLSATQRHVHADGSPLWAHIHVSRIGTGDDHRLVVTCKPLVGPPGAPMVEAKWQIARLFVRAIEGGKRAFGEHLIGNPATEIMLLAYIAEAEARAVTMEEIAASADIVWPLAQRWALALVDAGFLEAERAGHITRAMPVRLTPRALAMTEALFGELIAVARGTPVPA